VNGAELLVALLSLWRHMRYRECIEAHRAQIVAVAEAGEREYGVPAGLSLVTGFFETHLGCAHGEGGNWGAPIDRFHRHTAGTPMHAVRAMAASYRVCGTWVGAVGRFRSGLCHPTNPLHRVAVTMRVRTTRIIYQQAGLPVPEGL